MTIRARHVKSRSYDRLRHSRVFHSFLDTNAARLANTGTGRTVTYTNATNIVNEAAHGYTTGKGPVTLANSGGALPTGLAASTDYWINVAAAGTYTLHLTEDDAVAGTATVTFSTDGTGANTVLDSAVGETIFDVLLAGNTADDVRAMATADAL